MPALCADTCRSEGKEQGPEALISHLHNAPSVSPPNAQGAFTVEKTQSSGCNPGCEREREALRPEPRFNLVRPGVFRARATCAGAVLGQEQVQGGAEQEYQC